MTERRNDGTLGQEQRELTLPVIDVPSFRPSVALPVLDQRLRGTKFVSLAPKSILNSPQATGMDFWSINPYVGCEFGCTYCYARYAHRYVVERAHDQGRLSDEEFREFRGPGGWEAFERRIFVKENVLSALDADLRRYFRSAHPAHHQPAPLVIGTATDPYQPAWRRAARRPGRPAPGSCTPGRCGCSPACGTACSRCSGQSPRAAWSGTPGRTSGTLARRVSTPRRSAPACAGSSGSLGSR